MAVSSARGGSLIQRALHVVLLCWVCQAAVLAAEPAVVVLRSEGSAPYQEASEAILAGLARSADMPRDVMVTELEPYQASKPTGPRLLFALGTPACTWAVRNMHTSAILCTLLPRAAFERVLRETGRRPGPGLSAIYLNQSFARQVEFIKMALPKARRVGALWSVEGATAEPGLDAALQARGLQLTGAVAQPDEPVFVPLKRVLAESDVLLAIADPLIYNSSTIQNILLTSFRAQVPMVAFSPAYVRAGALMALYTTPAQLGQQAAGWGRSVLQGQPLPAPAHPQTFDIGINENVARSLGLQLNAAELIERLRRQEQLP